MTNAPSGTASPRPRSLVAASAALLMITLAACSTAPGPSPTLEPSGGPSSGPTEGPTATPATPSTPTGGLEHPTGTGDIVIRFEESGGFVPVEHNATYAPSFTLYGDGTVVFRDPYAVPRDTGTNVRLGIPFSSVKLDEAGIQAVLAEALNVGGLAVATGPYTCNCADIPTATFTISAGGATKQVSVTGLSPEVHSQNQAIVAQLAAFAELLRTFGDRIGGEGAYFPAGYRGVLMEIDQPFGPVSDWPWTDIAPADFEGGENEFFRTAVLTPAQVDALGVEGVEGGMTGINLQADGKLYSFSLRPLLPDEIA